MSVEAELLQLIHSTRSPLITEFFSSVSVLGSAIFSIILISALYLSGNEDVGKLTALSYGAMSAIVYPMKFLISRPRPEVANQIVQTTTQHSFPSGHTASAFVLATMLAHEKKELSYFFYSLAVLVGFSRMYLGVHYLSDVIAGGLIGYITVKLVLNYRDRIGSLIRMGDNL